MKKEDETSSSFFFIVADCVPAVGKEESNFNLRDTDCDNENVNTIWHSLSFYLGLQFQKPRQCHKNTKEMNMISSARTQIATMFSLISMKKTLST